MVVQPGPLQDQQAKWWRGAWDEVEREREELASLHGACKLAVLVNGDLTEGDHHNTSEIVSKNPGVEHQIAMDILAIPAALGVDAWMFSHGTESHAGKAGSRERGIVKAFRDAGNPVLEHPDTGDVLAFEWNIELGSNHQGRPWRFQATHHGRMGRTPRTKGSLASLTAADIWIEHQLSEWQRAEAGQVDSVDPEQYPHVHIASHWHQCVWSQWGLFPTQYVTLPCWTFKGHHAWKMASRSHTDFGLVYWLIEPGRRRPEMVPFRRKPQRSKPCRI